MPAMITKAGSAVDSSEMASPWMTLVPWPVTDDWAMERQQAEPTARNSYFVCITTDQPPWTTPRPIIVAQQELRER